MGQNQASVGEWLGLESEDRRAAWSRLSDLSRDVVRRIGGRCHLQAADREDLAGDVFFIAVEGDCARLRALQGSVSLAAWLFGVARNLVRERARSPTTVPLIPNDAHEPADGSVPGELAPLGNCRELIRRNVLRVLGVLTPEQREVEVALLEGLSERAIARNLRISRNAVRERVSRGRRRVKRRLALVSDSDIHVWETNGEDSSRTRLAGAAILSGAALADEGER